MSDQPSPFELLICDLLCVLSTCEHSYKPRQLRLTIMLVAPRDDISIRRHWLSRPCPAQLALRLQEEAESRGFTCVVSPIPARRTLYVKVRRILEAYLQRRIGIAIMAHRAAWPIVYEAGGLYELYTSAGQQLQQLAMKLSPSMADIRRAERFAKFVRLSAYHALMAKDLGTLH